MINNDWINSDKIDLEKHVGFIYRITNILTNRQYIGKKLLTSTINKKLTKKELLSLPVKRGKKPTKKKVVSESKWKDYWGSSEELKKDIELLGKENFKREILHAVFDKQTLSYLELRLQMEERVIENTENYYNYNILGKYYPNRIKNYETF